MDPISKLLHYFNEEPKDSTYYKLVYFSLKQITELPQLSISDFSEKTFVAKGSITRFVHFFDFENYKSFKSYFKDISNTSKNSFLRTSSYEANQLINNPDKFLYDYTEKVIKSLEDTRQTIRTEEIDEIINSLLVSKKIAIFGYSDARNIAMDIQLSCLAVGKLICVPKTTSKFKEICDHFNEQDLVIILSNYGNFFNIYPDFHQQLIKRKVSVILITQNYYSMNSFSFKQTLYLCSQRHLSVGNYPLRLFSEYFVRRLIFRSLESSE